MTADLDAIVSTAPPLPEPDVETLPGGIRVPGTIRVTATPDGADDLAVAVHLVVQLVDGRYVVADMRCVQVEGGPPVDSRQLRAVAVADIVARAVRPYVLANGEHAGGPWQPLTVGPDDAADGPTDRALRKVAALYRVAYMCGLAPTATVTETMGLKRPTAANWIGRARDRGLLGPTSERRAGEYHDG